MSNKNPYIKQKIGIIFILVITVALFVFFFMPIIVKNREATSGEPNKKESNDLKNQDIPNTKEYNAFISFDSLKIKELLKYFRVEKDEFSSLKESKYIPKDAPIYINANGLYCDFDAYDSGSKTPVPNNFRFHFQYFAKDWLFIESLTFNIDDEIFTYTPDKIERDNSGGDVWEWFNDPINSSSKEIVLALAKCKSAKIKINGQQYHEEKTVTKAQIQSIKRTVDFYKAMGGDINAE